MTAPHALANAKNPAAIGSRFKEARLTASDASKTIAVVTAKTE